MGDQASAKACVRCRTDVTSRPRVKDARGRYLCRPCFDAATARRQMVGVEPQARPADAPLPPDEPNPALFDLAPVAHAPASGPCPGCGHPLAAGAALCVNCGYNPRSGAQLATSVGVENVKTTKEDQFASQLRQTSREAHKKAWVTAASVAGFGLIATCLAIATLTSDPPTFFKIYGLTMALCIPASFLAFLVFAMAGWAGGVGFWLVLLEIAAVCLGYGPIFVLETYFPMPRYGRWILRGLVIGGLSTWLLDMEEPYNYYFAGVIFVLMLASVFGSVFILNAMGALPPPP